MNHLIEAVILALLPVFVAEKYYAAVPEDLGLTSLNFTRNVFLGITTGLLLSAAVFGLEQGIAKFIGNGHHDSPAAKLLKLSKDDIDVFIMSFSAVILAPISEEVFCRGFTYTIIKKRFGKFIGLVLSSLFFVGLHFDIWNALYLFIISIGLTLLFEKTKSLVPGITAHAAINIAAISSILMSR